MEKKISPLGMMHQLFADAQPLMKIVMLVILMGISTIIFTFIGMMVAVPVFSLSIEEIQNALAGGFVEVDLKLMRYFQGIQTIGIFIIPALLANRLILPLDNGFLKGGYKMKYMLFGALVFFSILIALPLIQSLIVLNESIAFPEFMSGIENKLVEMEMERNLLSERMISDLSGKVLLVNILIIAILPAIGEEFLFRGVIQRILQNGMGNPHFAILITAAVFSAFHLQFFGFFPRLLLGIYFGYIFLWTGNIWMAVIAHFLNNAIAILLIYLSSNQIVNFPIWFNDGSSPGIGITILSILFTCLAIVFSRRLTPSKGRW